MKTPGRLQRVFLDLAVFPALGLFHYFAAAGLATSRLLALSILLLAYCCGVIGLARRWDGPSYFDWAIAGYFALSSLLLAAFPGAGPAFLEHYALSGMYAFLFSAAFLPPLLGLEPFTVHYARRRTPPEAWDNPVFARINSLMSHVWAGLFALAFVLSLYPSVTTRFLLPALLMLGVGVPFNAWFPDGYLKRLGLPSLAEQTQSGPRPPPPRSLQARAKPDTAREAISRMPEVFSPRAAGDLSALIVFDVSGPESFQAALKIEKGTCRLLEAPQGKPDLLIRTPADVWLGIARGEISGQEAFMNRRYETEGNLGLLIRMGEIFTGPTSGETRKAERTQTLPDPVSTPQPTGATKPSPDGRSKEEPMNILAISSSPRGEGQSKSDLMLGYLVEGMREAGAEVEVVKLRKKKVKPCIGCFTCWTKTPGSCIHQDDMSTELFPKWLAADLVVYATPLYHFLMNAELKAFLERTLPVLQPFFEEGEGGNTRHPLRHAHPRFALLAVAGFPEESVFEQLSFWVRSVYGRHGLLAAEIYRAGAETLTVAALKPKAEAIFGATKQAGRELVETGTVSPETLARITQDIMEDKEAFHKIGNLMWKTCIAEGLTPKEMQAKGIVPRPDSLETFMLIMPMGFNPEAAGDTGAVLQFNFTGQVEGSCYLQIENGRAAAFPGKAEGPTLTIDAPFELWMDIMTGKADGQQAFMEGKYKVFGDLSLLMRMNELFGG